MATAFVDNLLKLLSHPGARGVRLEAGRPAQMVDAAGSPRNVSSRPLTGQEILGAIAPIVPEHARAQLPGAPSIEFEYSVPACGDFTVRIVRDGENLSVSILKGDDDAAAIPAAKVASLPAQAVGSAPPVPAIAAGTPHTASPIRVSRAPAAQAGREVTEAAAPAAPLSRIKLSPAPAPATPAALDERSAAESSTTLAEVEPVQAPGVAPVQVPLAPSGAGAATAGPGAHAIDAVLERMCAVKASDLHLCTGMPPLVRRDGEICPLDPAAAALDAAAMMRLLDPIMPDKNHEEFRRRHDTDFAYEIAGLARFRGNVFMDRKGPGAVFRVIPSKILTAEDLGLSPHILDLCRLNKGLVLVTGPTGSGKSTTLCAMVDYINRNRTDHIITIEDPIEFVHENKQCLMNQREVHTHTQSFKDALRAALREDPDIILVGEMRDLETVAIAIEMAETGHLVFGTLHTTTAASTVDRIIDQFPTDRQAQIRTMLSESLKGVIAQTLCRKIGGGRVAALETLIVTSPISNLIREGKTFQIPSMMQVGKASGMVTLNDALMELVTKKLVEPREAYLKAVDKSGFEALMKRAGVAA
jgi:twitching motility protein PilT